VTVLTGLALLLPWPWRSACARTCRTLPREGGPIFW